jgi:fumarate hydratase class II
MTESVKEILKPIRRKSQDAQGVEKMVYQEIIREIDIHCGKHPTRQDIINELERQQCEIAATLEEDMMMVTALNKGKGYINWGDVEGEK